MGGVQYVSVIYRGSLVPQLQPSEISNLMHNNAQDFC